MSSKNSNFAKSSSCLIFVSFSYNWSKSEKSEEEVSAIIAFTAKLFAIFSWGFDNRVFSWILCMRCLLMILRISKLFSAWSLDRLCLIMYLRCSLLQSFVQQHNFELISPNINWHRFGVCNFRLFLIWEIISEMYSVQKYTCVPEWRRGSPRDKRELRNEHDDTGTQII